MDNVRLEGSVVPAGTTLNSFQQGVSPTSAYTHDATYIRSSDVGNNFNDVGQLIVGVTEGGNADVLRSLLEFDVSAIPASDQIDSASLVLTTYSTAGINKVGNAGETTSFDVYEYGYDIDETAATWNAPGSGDTSAGGTSGALLTSADFDVEITGQTITFADTPAFRTAVSDALAGDGFLRLILRGSDETTGIHNFARFSDDTFDPFGNRPELLVLHSAVPEPSTIVLFVICFSMLGLSRLRFRGRRA